MFENSFEFSQSYFKYKCFIVFNKFALWIFKHIIKNNKIIIAVVYCCNFNVLNKKMHSVVDNYLLCDFVTCNFIIWPGL